MNTNQRTRIAALLALCGAFAASSALAQESGTKTETKNKELQGSYDQPLLRKRRSADNNASTSKTTMISTEDGHTYSVTIEDGKVSASVDGDEVPADRVKTIDDRVVILSEDGKELKSFNLVTAKGGTFNWSGNALSNMRFLEGVGGGAGGNDAPQPADFQPPPVMVGITMSDPDPIVLEHLGVDAESAFMIDRVVDGLPAEKAGLQARDIVVALDGKKPATQEKFREVLRSKKAGDTLEMTVMRKGKEEHAKIVLITYDREKLGMGTSRPGEFRVTPWLRDNGQLELGIEGHGGHEGHWTDEARQTIEKVLKELKENPDLQPEKIKAHAEKALKEALAAFEEGKVDVARRFGNMRGWTFKEGEKPDVVFGPQGQRFTVPGVPHTPEANPEMTQRLERLTDQLDRLNKRLEEMERRMEKGGGR